MVVPLLLQLGRCRGRPENLPVHMHLWCFTMGLGGTFGTYGPRGHVKAKDDAMPDTLWAKYPDSHPTFGCLLSEVQPAARPW